MWENLLHFFFFFFFFFFFSCHLLLYQTSIPYLTCVAQLWFAILGLCGLSSLSSRTVGSLSSWTLGSLSSRTLGHSLRIIQFRLKG